MPDVEKTEDHSLVSGRTEQGGICSLFLPSSVDGAFRESNFEIQEFVDVLLSIIREDRVITTTRRDGSVVEVPAVSPREKMAALAMLERKARESMVLGGLIANERLNLKKRLGDGTVAEYDSENMRLVQEGSSRLRTTMDLLEQANSSKSNEILDVSVSESEVGSSKKEGIKKDGSDGTPEVSSGGRDLGGTGLQCGHGPGNSSGRSGGVSGGGGPLLGPTHGAERTIPAPPSSSGDPKNHERTVGGTKNE